MAKLRLTREQLALFLQNHEQIKQFEKLFEATNFTLDELIDLLIQAGSAQATASAALAGLERMTAALEALAIPRSQHPPETDITPAFVRPAAIQDEPFIPARPVPVDEPPFPALHRVLRMNDLADAKVRLPANRQSLVNDGNGAWRNDFLKLDDLSDVVITAPAIDDSLKYDGDKWINGPTGPVVQSGTFTPAMTDAYNTAAITPLPCQYLRVGAVVTVSGMAVVTPATSGDMVAFNSTLPIPSSFGGPSQAAGTFVTSDIPANPMAGAIRAVAVDTIRFDGVAASTGVLEITYSYTYLIV